MEEANDDDNSLHAAIGAMRANRPLHAEEICRNYLVEHPSSTAHLRLLSHALMKQKRLTEAEENLRFALSLEPRHPQLHEDLGSVLALAERYEEAVPVFESAISLEPRLPLARKKLGQALAMLGRSDEADAAFGEFIDSDPERVLVAAGMQLLQEDKTDDAIEKFKEVLRENPDNVDAMRALASAYLQSNQKMGDAEALLRRTVQIAPDFAAAWMLLGAILNEQGRYRDSIAAYRKSAELEPDNAQAHGSLGNALAHAGDAEQADRAFAQAVRLEPKSAGLQMGHAHVLKTLGDQSGALRAYRAAIAVKPDFGEVYWSMANLKVFEFEPGEVLAMQKQLERDDLSTSARVHLLFSLGKAFEDKRDYDQAWHYYDSGNRLQRDEVSHDPLEFETRCHKIIETFNKPYLEQHAGNGVEGADPIFIVGLPRSGSTLLEQILASHSQVEGTAELPDLGRVATSIGRYHPDGVQYPESVADLRPQDWRAFGQQYLDDTRQYRQTAKPRFTDKLPNNFPHVGLLHLILPNARIINARRHPLDSCLGCYKQLFGKGQNFTYDMDDLAEYYLQYDAVMRHWHDVLPGNVLDVHYEDTVLDLEAQVRRILEFCGLPFEQACVDFHRTERAVKTASSEQVRQPIYRGGLGKWRRYEKYLDLWQSELSGVIEALPESVRDAGLQP